MTAFVRIKRDGQYKNLDILELTPTELETFLNTLSLERVKMWAKFFHERLRYIPDNNGPDYDDLPF